MTVKQSSEDEIVAAVDKARIDAVLSFWFKEKELTAPQIDGRMDVWFGEDPMFDEEVATRFADEVKAASDGLLDDWASDARGRLALIILIDQFRRNIFRNSPEAFSNDKAALKLCVEGAMVNADKSLSAIERVFFYMPLQHAESRKVQRKSVEIFSRLAAAVSATHKETFDTVVQFAELHADIVEQFGRFPHRNKLMGRENTAQEAQYLAGDVPTFGQGED
jgi:uncharacterized protein (DUF924 family)